MRQPFWEALPNWELPREIHISKRLHLDDENLQNAYEHCLDLLLGNCGEHKEPIVLKEEVRDKYNLTYENTKYVLTLAEHTVREYIEGISCD